MAPALAHARVDLPEVWKGNAASEMRTIADIYEGTSAGTKDMRAAVDYVIDQAGDAVIIFTTATAIAAGTVSAATGTGPLIGGGVAIFEAKVIKDGFQYGAEAKGAWEALFGTYKSHLPE